MFDFELSASIEHLACWASLPPSSCQTEDKVTRYSHQHYPVLRRKSPVGCHEFAWMRLGFIPSYAHDESGSLDREEAHAESLNCASCFRSAFRRRRCLIPADVVHICPETEGSEACCSLELDTGEIFGIAGIWETWCNDQGHAIETFAVISTRAGTVLPTVLNRIPVIVAPSDQDRWLHSEPSEQAPYDLLRSLSGKDFVEWRLMPHLKQ
ncbi:SOS response-associated peptidase family protein [Edaphobacter sp. HDX4]|uniref:SOS response-associated peptidase family protein n=1 Tax=Edaphobacter sp. HDX4 TaxID=2794064 RepID=UPI002FE50FB0